jgi:formate hydrogenlyase subunit 3/multisubunit Na+/H+ antiporter MnhD subunit
VTELVLHSLLVAAILWPLVLFATCIVQGTAKGVTPWLASAPLPAVVAALFCRGFYLTLSPSTLMPFTLQISTPGAVLLGVSGFLWSMAAFDLPRRLADNPHRKRFVTCWLLTLTGNLGVFIAADVMAFFVFYALASLSAYGLVIHEETREARHAGKVYIGFALFGEALLLMGLVLLVHNPQGGSFHIADAVAALPDSPWFPATLLLLVSAFALKLGLIPGHGWLPLAHSVAPAPASAVLSGAILNAGVMGLILFVPFQAQYPDGTFLMHLGFATAFFGVAIGLTQKNPKSVLAYSSVSQMGFIAAVCGMGMTLGTGADTRLVTLPIAFYAAHHTLVKGGVFLAAGIAELRGNNRFALWALPSVLIGLGLAGLPFTGGMLAKLAVKDILGKGVAATLATGSSAATACLMTLFIFRLVQKRAPAGPSPRIAPLMTAWLLLALAALALPWVLHPLVESISLSKVLSLLELWKGSWPIALGALLGAWFGVGDRLPRIPAGDIFHLAPALDGILCSIRVRIETCERFLRRWEVSGTLLVSFVAVLALLLFFARP